MKSLAFLLVSLIAISATAAEVLVEAESFADRGGWTLDPQFLDVMGSPYLLAHGLGQPVAHAATEVEFPETGRFHFWVIGSSLPCRSSRCHFGACTPRTSTTS